MSAVITAIVGLIVGGGAGYFLVQQYLSKNTQGKIEEANKTADTTVAEARVAAKRLTEEAESKAEKIVDRAESKNEIIKQKKIQEAREKYSQMKTEFETEKANHVVVMKDKEIGLVNKEIEFKQKQQGLQSQLDELTKQKLDLEQKSGDI